MIVVVGADQALLEAVTSVVRQLAMSLDVLGVAARGGAEVHDRSLHRGGRAGDQRAAQSGGHCRQAVTVFAWEDGSSSGYCGLLDGGERTGPYSFCGHDRHSHPGRPSTVPAISAPARSGT